MRRAVAGVGGPADARVHWWHGPVGARVGARAVVRVIDAVRGPAGDARRCVLLLIAASAVVLS